MGATSEEVISELKKYATPSRAETNMWFFKTGPGEYGEGDKFLGLRVPDSRKVAKKFTDLDLSECKKLLNSEWHEVRLAGLHILVYQYQKSDNADKKKIFEFYQKNLKGINNWDLVDSSAPYIPGPYLFDKDRSWLYELVEQDDLWKKRISIISTFYFIKQGDFGDTLKISEILLDHPHDLIHKAVGWMLREVGNIDRGVEEEFLKKHYQDMPRTMLRYAIEKFPEDLRQDYLKGRV